MNIGRSMLGAITLAAASLGLLAGNSNAAVPETSYCTGATNSADVVIPDLGTASSTLNLECAGLPASSETKINVAIIHPRSGELVVDLVSPDGSSHRLKPRTFGVGNLVQTFTKDFSYLNPTGRWTLRVTDTSGGNRGYISSFGMLA